MERTGRHGSILIQKEGRDAREEGAWNMEEVVPVRNWERM